VVLQQRLTAGALKETQAAAYDAIVWYTDERLSRVSELITWDLLLVHRSSTIAKADADAFASNLSDEYLRQYMHRAFAAAHVSLLVFRSRDVRVLTQIARWCEPEQRAAGCTAEEEMAAAGAAAAPEEALSAPSSGGSHPAAHSCVLGLASSGDATSRCETRRRSRASSRSRLQRSSRPVKARRVRSPAHLRGVVRPPLPPSVPSEVPSVVAGCAALAGEVEVEAEDAPSSCAAASADVSLVH
jgi:hypothetical protein